MRVPSCRTPVRIALFTDHRGFEGRSRFCYALGSGAADLIELVRMLWTTKSSVLARKSKNASASTLRLRRGLRGRQHRAPRARKEFRSPAATRCIASGHCLLIAGSGPEHAGIAHWLRTRSRPRLLLLGTILDRSSFYDALDAFILPSLYEALPMAVLEAMSSGVPVLSSRLEGISAVIAEENEGLLARPGDVADFRGSSDA